MLSKCLDPQFVGSTQLPGLAHERERLAFWYTREVSTPHGTSTAILRIGRIDTTEKDYPHGIDGIILSEKVGKLIILVKHLT